MTMSMQGDSADTSNGHAQGGSFDSPHMLGVRVVVDPDPAIAGARVADQLGGDLIFDIETARTAFAARADAARVDPVVLGDDELDHLLRQADEIEALAETGDDHLDLDDATLTELRTLAATLGTTERIRTRTELEFTETLNRRLSASSGMAVHPASIKQASAAVVDAEAGVDGIDNAIAGLGERPEPEQVLLNAPDTVPEMFDDEGLERQRRSRAFALGVGTIFAGAALAMLSIGIPVIIPIAVFVAGLVIAGLVMARSYSGRKDRGAAEASALLVAATGNAERTTEAAARDRLAEEEWLARRAQLDADHERGLERVRSARRHWETLAGPEADPHDLEAVLRMHDPQFVITDAATRTSPTVRTVNAVHRKATARWKIAWAALGYDRAPAVEDFEAQLIRLGGRSGAQAQLVENRLKAAEAWENAGAIIDRPMILVEPEVWIDESELESLLATLPAGVGVVVVTR
jgi:hypothetical protein